MLGKKWRKIVASVICAVVAGGLSAATVTVEAGGEHVVAASENNINTVFLLQDGSRLAISSGLGTDVTLKACVKIAENAAAVLKVAEDVASLRIQGGLYALSGASLQVTGIGLVSVGQEASASAINTTSLDIATLTFADENAEGLRLVDSVTIRCAPRTCPLAIADGANLALMRKNVLEPFGLTGDLTLSSFDVVLLADDAIPSTNTVTVMPGRTLYVKPCNPNGDWAWGGRRGTFKVPSVVLAGAGARVVFRNSPPVDYNPCPVSGTGDVVFLADTPNAASTMLYGPFTYTGVFAVDNASYVTSTTDSWGEEGVRTLRLANGAKYRANGVGAFSSLALSGSATMELLFNSRVTIGEIEGGDTLTLAAGGGVGGGTAAFTGSFPAGFVLSAVDGAYCTFADGVLQGCLASPTPAGMEYRWANADGVVDCTGLIPATGAMRATAHAGVSVLTNVPSSLAVSAEGPLAMASVSSTVSVRAEAGGTVRYTAADADWKRDVLLWIDPSTASFSPVGGHASNVAQVDGNTVFASIADVRPEQTVYALKNTRDTTATKSTVNWQVYPLAVPEACNGLTAMSLGPYQKTERLTYTFADGSEDITKSATSARRILVAKNGKTTSDVPLKAAAVTMVFGSQNGGGAALLGTLDGAFCRSGTTCAAGITTNTNYRIFVNGVLVADPPSQPLSGGWDVVTIEMEGKRLSAFGWGGSDGSNNDYNHSGGQNYGEIIVFSACPSDEQRLAAERYLAKKWGLADKYAGMTNVAVLSGSGTVRTDGTDVNVSGRFSGTIDLAGGTLTVAAPAVAPDETSVPRDGLAGWFDPDDPDFILLNKDTEFEDAAISPNRLWVLYDKNRPSRADGDAYLFGSRYRRPIIRRAAYGDGPERNWIHFPDNDNLRFCRLPLPDLEVSVVTAQPLEGVREIFVVQNSSRGGGTPVIDRINTDESVSYMKIQPRRTADAAAPIWANHGEGTIFTDASVTSGVTRLNGTVVDGSHTGFTGRDEIFSFSTTAAYEPLALGDLWNADVAGTGAYEIIGETLFFTRVLSDGERKTVIDYLNAKWRGVTPAGGGDFTGAVVTGHGAVEGADLATMPHPSATFAGTFTVSGNADRVFTVWPIQNRVEGALLAPGTTFSLPAAAQVTVNVRERLPADRCTLTLIDGAAFATETDWTLTLDSEYDVRGWLRVVGGKLLLYLDRSGSAIIIR